MCLYFFFLSISASAAAPAGAQASASSRQQIQLSDLQNILSNMNGKVKMHYVGLSRVERGEPI